MHCSYVGAASKRVHCEFSLRVPCLISITCTCSHNTLGDWAFAVLLIRRQKNIAKRTRFIFSFFLAISSPLSFPQRLFMGRVSGSYQTVANPLMKHSTKVHSSCDSWRSLQSKILCTWRAAGLGPHPEESKSRCPTKLFETRSFRSQSLNGFGFIEDWKWSCRPPLRH